MSPWLTYLLLAILLALLLVSLVPDRLPARWRSRRLERFSVALTFAALLGAYGLLRTGKGDDGEAAIRQAGVAGKPLLLEFFSNT